MGEYGIVITTVPRVEEAESLARLLLEYKLVACVQVDEIHSYYRWQGEIQGEGESEQRLWIKCRVADYGVIEQLIKAHHSYELPEIILLTIAAGSPDYLNWIAEETVR
jgi:periplasmic divalent cation tolerance protein